MNMSSQVTIVGNITRDPDLKYTPNGAAVVKLGVAVNKRVKQNGEWVDGDPSFFDVTAWNTLAENIAETLAKGNRVVVTGRLEQRSWEQDGNKRYAVEIVADEVAPSLRWATAVVTRTEKGNGTSRPTADDGFGTEPF